MSQRSTPILVASARTWNDLSQTSHRQLPVFRAHVNTERLYGHLPPREFCTVHALYKIHAYSHSVLTCALKTGNCVGDVRSRSCQVRADATRIGIERFAACDRPQHVEGAAAAAAAATTTDCLSSSSNWKQRQQQQRAGCVLSARWITICRRQALCAVCVSLE